jgi:hypothetical protein
MMRNRGRSQRVVSGALAREVSRIAGLRSERRYLDYACHARTPARLEQCHRRTPMDEIERLVAPLDQDADRVNHDVDVAQPG